jgi:subtilase family serine protease
LSLRHTSLLRRSLAVGLVAVAGPTAFGVATASAVPQRAARLPTHAPVTTGHVVALGCAVAAPGSAGCAAEAVSPLGDSGPAVMAGPTGYTPAQIQSAYALTGDSTPGSTVAIVDADKDPDLASDLATYRTQFGLPACTQANGCLTIENQHGKPTKLPTGNPAWGLEESLDVDAVSATCPSCDIAVVEAASPSMANLMTAVRTAATIPGVVAISNSYVSAESSTESSDDPAYDHPGIAVTASSGDHGFGVNYPAASPGVTAVGGTELVHDTATSRGWIETAWGGSGSGCSAYEPKPAWQTDSGCVNRTVADVSADADPVTGLAVYDTYDKCGTSKACDVKIEEGKSPGLDGWGQIGGTSLSSPLIASVYALAGNTGSVDGANLPYADPAGLFDVTTGLNGSCGSYLCEGVAGYDGPTGLGTPDGTTAF